MARKPRSFGNMVGIWTSKYPPGNQWRKHDTRLVWDSRKGKTFLGRPEMTVGKAVPAVPRAYALPQGFATIGVPLRSHPCRCVTSRIAYWPSWVRTIVETFDVSNLEDAFIIIITMTVYHEKVTWDFFFKMTFHGCHLWVWLAKSLCNIHGRFDVSVLAREWKLNKL